MFRNFALTGLIAAAIATAPVAVPAAYAKNDLEKFLLGVAAIGVVGAIAHDQNKKKRQRYVAPIPQHQPRHSAHGERHGHGDVRHRHPHGNQHHRGPHRRADRGFVDPVPKQHRKQVRQHQPRLPNQCLRQRWTNQGWVQYYGKKCLRQNGY